MSSAVQAAPSIGGGAEKLKWKAPVVLDPTPPTKGTAPGMSADTSNTSLGVGRPPPAPTPSSRPLASSEPISRAASQLASASPKLISLEILGQLAGLAHSFDTWKQSVDKRLADLTTDHTAVLNLMHTADALSRERWSMMQRSLEAHESTLRELVAALRSGTISRGESSEGMGDGGFGAEHEYTQGIYNDMDHDSPALTGGVTPEQLQMEFNMEAQATAAEDSGGIGESHEAYGMSEGNGSDGISREAGSGSRIISLGPFSTSDCAILQPQVPDLASSSTITLQPAAPLPSPPSSEGVAEELLVTPPGEPVDMFPLALSVKPRPAHESLNVQTGGSGSDNHDDGMGQGATTPLASAMPSAGNVDGDEDKADNEGEEGEDAGCETPGTPTWQGQYEVYEISGDASQSDSVTVRKLKTPDMSVADYVESTNNLREPLLPSPDTRRTEMEEELEVKEELASSPLAPRRLVQPMTREDTSDSSDPSWSPGPDVSREMPYIPSPTPSQTSPGAPRSHGAKARQKRPASPSPVSHEELGGNSRRRVSTPIRAKAPPSQKSSSSKKKPLSKRRSTGGTYLDRRLKSQIILRRSDGRKRGKGEWPLKGPNSRKGRLQEIICESCMGRCHWSCAGFDAFTEPSNWACPDCQAARESGDTMPQAPLLECIRHNCILRENRRYDDIEGDDDEYVVEKVLGRRAISRDELGIRHFEYLIKWAGYPMSECTWEPKENLGGDMLIDAFVRDLRDEDDDADRSLCRRVTLLDQARTHFDKFGEPKGKS